MDEVNSSSELLINFKKEHVDDSFVQVTLTIKRLFTVMILRLVNRAGLFEGRLIILMMMMIMMMMMMMMIIIITIIKIFQQGLHFTYMEFSVGPCKNKIAKAKEIVD